MQLTYMTQQESNEQYTGVPANGKLPKQRAASTVGAAPVTKKTIKVPSIIPVKFITQYCLNNGLGSPVVKETIAVKLVTVHYRKLDDLINFSFQVGAEFERIRRHVPLNPDESISNIYEPE